MKFNQFNNNNNVKSAASSSTEMPSKATDFSPKLKLKFFQCSKCNRLGHTTKKCIWNSRARQNFKNIKVSFDDLATMFEASDKSDEEKLEKSLNNDEKSG